MTLYFLRLSFSTAGGAAGQIVNYFLIVGEIYNWVFNANAKQISFFAVTVDHTKTAPIIELISPRKNNASFDNEFFAIIIGVYFALAC